MSMYFIYLQSCSTTGFCLKHEPRFFKTWVPLYNTKGGHQDIGFEENQTTRCMYVKQLLRAYLHEIRLSHMNK